MGRKLRLGQAAKLYGRAAYFYRQLVLKEKITGYYAEGELNVDEDEVVRYWNGTSNRLTQFERTGKRLTAKELSAVMGPRKRITTRDISAIMRDDVVEGKNQSKGSG